MIHSVATQIVKSSSKRNVPMKVCHGTGIYVNKNMCDCINECKVVSILYEKQKIFNKYWILNNLKNA